jgi:ElaB/YqjD/DUF883 family membrane-anchored ribosome-binding protein
MRTKQGNGHKVDLQKLLEDLRVVVKDGEQLLKASVTTVKDKALVGARTTDLAIRRSPYQTLGIAFGLGLIVGMIATGVFSGNVSEAEDEF